MTTKRVTTIQLNRAWRLWSQLASGGFGRVHGAEADDGSAAVVKLVPKAPGARRELLFEELSGSPNIIPILDSGEWEDYYVLVMPRAEKSLRKHLEEAGGRLDLNEAMVVLTDVAEALASIEAEVVHRDLKPENVLLYKGQWCLADFGIARYAEATTASDTRKYAMTPPYAAPEQWRGERARSATDVYAFGVMAFELLDGTRPFPGPDFREQHLDEPPPALSGFPPSLASLIGECLFKAAAARPTAANILARLRGSGRPVSPVAGRLQEVQKVVVERQGEEAARVSAQKSKEEARRELFQAAKQSFRGITEALRQRALEAAPATKVSTPGGGFVLHLGNGALVIEEVQVAPADCLAAFEYEPAFDVIAYTVIAARKPRDQYDYEGRAHSLWFCDAQNEGVYRWYELAFMVFPTIPERHTLDPFALSPTDEYAGRALAPVTGVRQVAWQPIPLDQGEEEQFIERWLGWFAAAAEGSLSHPSTMPENSGGRYRSPRRHQGRP
jgi:serine/threonine-protein kinase